MLHISNSEALKTVYFVYFHSLMKNGIILGGDSADSKKVFTLQKKTVRIVMGVIYHNSCRDLFKRIQILIFPCLYTLINFITNAKNTLRRMQMYTVLTQDTNTVTGTLVRHR
jgi:hypothetical protein